MAAAGWPAMIARVRQIAERLIAPEPDPPDPWEQRIRADQVARVSGGGPAGHPYRPSRWQDVPVGAVDALDAASGARRLEQFFVIPAGCRPTGLRRARHVATPTQVLALGDDAIALWVDSAQPPAVRARIALEALAAIDDRQVLLDGRLSFLSAEGQLTIRYNTVARAQLEPAITTLRAVVAGEPSPLPAHAAPDELPLKWRNVARSPRVLLAPGEPAVLLFAPRPAAPRDTLVAITAHELVVARHPQSRRRTRDYGVDSLCVARRRLHSVTAADRSLRIRSAGVSLDVDVGATVARACARLLGG
jgi:hypothetical protein